jgi:hypothetical protein
MARVNVAVVVINVAVNVMRAMRQLMWNVVPLVMFVAEKAVIKTLQIIVIR